MYSYSVICYMGCMFKPDKGHIKVISRLLSSWFYAQFEVHQKRGMETANKKKTLIHKNVFTLA